MEIENIPLDRVHPSPMNPRKTFDEEGLAELAANIDKQGLLQPITVRPKVYTDYNDPEDPGHIISLPSEYEIICGERRYRAMCRLAEGDKATNAVRASAGMAPLPEHTTIAAIVRDMDDEEAFDAMITENLQRKDVDPIEEAFAFGQLAERGKSIEEIANRFGKSVRFVQDRIKLNGLVPELMLAIKEERMSISAAMIIAKLDEDAQKEYYKSYCKATAGFTKETAVSFTNSLFMSIDMSPWNRAVKGCEDFAGGCGRSCSECQYNTANAGCLFWEMKAKDAGKCTNREMFYSKHIAFVVEQVKALSKKLIPLNKPLETGKMVIVEDDEYCSGNFKELKARVYDAIRAEGFEVVNAQEIFEGKCWYEPKDERFKKKKEQNKIYKCLRIFSYDRVSLDTEWRYFKGGSRDDDKELEDSPSVSKVSVEAMKLLQKRNRMREIATERITEQSRALAGQLKEAKRKGPLSDNERLAFDILIFTLQGKPALKKYGHDNYGKPSDRSFIDVIKQNQADRDTWVREVIRETISSAEITYNKLYQYCASLVLKEWKPDEWQKIVKASAEKLDKDLAKNAEKLKELGYDIDGKLLPDNGKD